MNELPRPEAPPASVPVTSDTGTHVRTSWRIRLITSACLFTLFGLGITIVHLVWPSPIMFALFMTLGQGAFGIAMVLYLVVIFIDLRRRKVL